MQFFCFHVIKCIELNDCCIYINKNKYIEVMVNVSRKKNYLNGTACIHCLNNTGDTDLGQIMLSY